MIGRIAGRIDYRATDHVLIDVRGVGYLVYCSDRTMRALPGLGEVVALYTDLLVRDDLLQLFGFPTLLEKEWHRMLMSVQGVGAKASLAIMGTLGPEGVSRAIALGDWNAVKAAKGIGPKTAQRVVNELKDKAADIMALGVSAGEATHTAPVPEDDVDVVEALSLSGSQTSAVSATGSGERTQAQAEALSALRNLGYAPGEAAGAVARAAGEAVEISTGVLIRDALKLLAPKE